MEATGEQMTLFSQVASRDHANHTAQQVSDLEKKMTATSGQKCLEQFEKLNRSGMWAKTFAGLLIGMEGWYSTKCRLTWKMKASKLSRFYFQLAPSTLHTEGIEFGLLPTPRASESIERRNMKTVILKVETKGDVTLTTLAKYNNGILLPTPMASDGGTKLTGLENQDSLTKRARKMPGKTSQLNPLFVEEMMGFPENWTALPFQNGETKA